MGQPWYEDWFTDEHYLALYTHRNSEEASRVLDLIIRSTGIKNDAAVLDLACGAGRHSINLAKRGFSNITAIDLSPTLIDEARNAAESASVTINFKEQDIRSFEGMYDLIMNLFTSFGYFSTDEENENVIKRVGQHLYPNGYFVLDFLNASILCDGVMPHDEKILQSGERVEQDRSIRHGRIEKKIIIHTEKGPKVFHESVRLFDLQDFERMFFAAGLTITEKFGDYDGSPFESGSSPRLFLVAKKDEK